jgi:hypothetical protein
MWDKLKAFFLRSETVFWARLQVVLGIAAAVVTYVDPSVLQPIIPSAYYPLLLVANGVFSEYLRRRNDPDIGKGQ